MIKTGCRIGKIRMKAGGAEIRVFPSRHISECSNATAAMGSKIDEDTLLVGFFILRRDRTVVQGWSYESGVTLSDALGGCESLKTEMIERF